VGRKKTKIAGSPWGGFCTIGLHLKGLGERPTLWGQMAPAWNQEKHDHNDSKGVSKGGLSITGRKKNREKLNHTPECHPLKEVTGGSEEEERKKPIGGAGSFLWWVKSEGPAQELEELGADRTALQNE